MTSAAQLAETPPGPQLAALLEVLDPDTLPAPDAVAVLQAWSRQRAHDHSRLSRTISRVAQLNREAGAGHTVGDWAGMEIAAALTWTDATAARELDFADTLTQLPIVAAAFDEGRIDHGKARVFTDILAAAALTDAQIAAVCARLVPLAPRLTAGQLRHRLLRAVLAVDHDYAHRRYRRALSQARVHGYLAPDGTAVVTATGLAPDEAAAACARVDALAERLRRSGHPGGIHQIRTTVFVALLDGRLTGLTADQIVATLLTTPTPDTDDRAGEESSADSGSPVVGATSGSDSSAHSDPVPAEYTATEGDPESDREPESDGDIKPITRPAQTTAGAETTSGAEITKTDDQGDDSPVRIENTTDPYAPAPAPADPDRSSPNRLSSPAPAGTHTSDCTTDESSTDPDAPLVLIDLDECGPPTPVPNNPVPDEPQRGVGPDPDLPPPHGRAGVEIRVGLLTLLGLDTRPGEIPGWGPVLPDTARILAARQHHAEWRFALLDDDGHLLLAGTTPHRLPAAGEAQSSGGIVEIHIHVTDLLRLDRDRGHHPGWAALIRHLVSRWERRDHLQRLLDAHPDARFARGPLARHIEIRDRVCVAPGCRRPATACQLDHTVDHASGGITTRINVGPLCPRHHTAKHQGGWRLRQQRPGRFHWTSPLGQIYDTRGEPIAPPLPEPVDRADDQTRPGPALQPGPTFDPRPPRQTADPPPTPPRRGSPWNLPSREDSDDPPPF